MQPLLSAVALNLRGIPFPPAQLFALNNGYTSYAALVTVLDVIQLSTDFLAKKGVESPRLQAELLLSHLLRMPRMQLYLNFQRPLTSEEENLLRDLVKRRGAREPLQHLTGSVSFCGLELEVTSDVLIPRPETEILAEEGWRFVNEQLTTNRNSDGTSIASGIALDFGTGSGCLAIALAVHCPGSRVVALDISARALEVARRNALHHAVLNRIDFILGDRLSALPKNISFDLIVTNPPYIPTGEIDHLEPEVRDHDPRCALDGGSDGLLFYRQLAAEAGALLKPGGKLMSELGDGQEAPVADLFRHENWIVERIVKDYTQRPRILIASRKL